MPADAACGIILTDAVNHPCLIIGDNQIRMMTQCKSDHRNKQNFKVTSYRYLEY